MKYFVAGEEVSIRVEFKLDGDPISPDANSVVYTLYDNSNVALSGASDVVVATSQGAQYVDIKLNASRNQKSTTFERRTLLVKYDFEGRNYEQSVSYILTDRLFISGGPEEVRSEIGVQPHELPDEDIDVTWAYLELEDEYDISSFLSLGTMSALHAQRAVIYRAAANAVDRLHLRIASSERSDGNSFSRLLNVDLNALKKSLAVKVTDALEKSGVVTETSPVFLQTATPTDEVTGN